MSQPTTDPSFPSFFDEAPTVTMRDPLAGFLGSARDGVMEFCYADAVRLAGHSCPTVAGTYLMILHGLRALYGDQIPVRGEIEVAMAESRDAGTTGVMASVAQLITGAAPETGFAGIAGRFDRRELLSFDQPVQGIIGLRRQDTGAGVEVQFDASVVPGPVGMQALMSKAAGGQATPTELTRFGELFQDRVRQILVEHADDPQMIQVVVT